MIRLTRLNRAPIVLNSDLIEHIDVTPDTVITLTTGQILRVRETAEEVINRIVRFRRRVFAAEAAAPAANWDEDEGDESENDEPSREEAGADCDEDLITPEGQA